MKGFMFMGLAGFLAGMFMAPKKGSELRGEICDKMTELKNTAKDKGRELKEVVMPVISQVKEEGCTLKSESKEMLNDVHACLDKNLENSKQVMEGAKERLNDKVAPVVSLIKDDARALDEKAHEAVDKMNEKVDELKQKGSEALTELKHKAS